jgi:type IV secretion system protein VirD4
VSDYEEMVGRLFPRGVDGNRGSVVEARWMDPAELMRPDWDYRDKQKRMAGLVLGYHPTTEADVGRGVLDDRHVLTVAGSRGGKGVSLIIPNLLTYEGSVLAIDPKGELARVTARARRQLGQKVVILDPFKVNRRYQSDSFNPLAEIDPKSPNAKEDAGRIADALIIGNERDPHWTDSARTLVKAIILFVMSEAASQVDEGMKVDRDLNAVWRLLSLSHPYVLDVARRKKGDAPSALWSILQNCDEFDGTVAGAGHHFARLADRELASVMSTARTQLEFLDSNFMQAVLSDGEFSLSELKTGKATLYLCLPATSMGTHSRWLRVLINLALVAFERVEQKPDIPVLMVLDEFPVLGHMQSIETAAGLMAGFGVKLWVVLQDLTQVKRHYKDSWETFISNAGVATFWANSDKTTLDYLSERLGQTGVRIQQPSGATPGAKLQGASSTREELRVQRLLAPDEISRAFARETGFVLVLRAGRDPAFLKRIVYHARDEPFAGLYDPAD